MAFVVNGSEWCFDGLPVEDVERIIEDFLEFKDISNERGEAVEIGDDFQNRPMREADTLWDMFAENSDQSLSGELRQSLAAWLGSARYYADAAEWPDGAENTVVSIGESEPNENPDVAWVHHCVRAGIPAACFSLGDPIVCNTKTESGEAVVYFVRHDDQRIAFWRNQILIEGDNDVCLPRLAPHAYPEIHFVSGVLSHLNRLSGGYLASRNVIRSTFASLNDWGDWVFNCPPPAETPDENGVVPSGDHPSNQLIEKRFLGFGMTVVPEKPNVYQKKNCREARETVLSGRTLYCEWHVKIELHRNRIHIHKPVAESNHKVIVGMIAEHLPLP